MERYIPLPSLAVNYVGLDPTHVAHLCKFPGRREERKIEQASHFLLSLYNYLLRAYYVLNIVQCSWVPCMNHSLGLCSQKHWLN